MRISTLIIIISILGPGCQNGVFNQAPIETDENNTAAHNLAAVNSAADSYAQGLGLLTIYSDGVDSDGVAETWYYEYVDTTSLPPITYCFHATYDTIIFDSNSVLKDGAGIINHTWFDSDVALHIAEQNGGSQFRGQHPSCIIHAGVYEPVVANPTTFWYIRYRAAVGQDNLLSLIIDANTGTIDMKYP